MKFKGVTFTSPILFLACLSISGPVLPAKNAHRTAVTYNQPGSVTWVGSINNIMAVMEVDDFDRDGIYDLRLGRNVYANSGTNADWVLPEFLDGSKIDLPKNGEGFRIDYDNDGDLDFIYEDELRYFENTGTTPSPTWVDRGKIKANGNALVSDFSSYKHWDNWGSPSLVMIDWDEDGRKDLVVSVTDRTDRLRRNKLQREVYSQGRVHFYKNIGTHASPVFDAGRKLQASGDDLNLPYRGYIEIFDYDNDSDLEIVFANYRGQLGVVEKSGSAIDCHAPSILNTMGEVVLQMDAADLDGDGNRDLVLMKKVGLEVFEHTPEGYRLKSRAKVANGESIPIIADTFMQPCVVDWEDDGDLDIMTGGEQGFLFLFENVGSDANPRYNDAVRLEVNGEPLNFDATTQGSFRWGLFEAPVGYTAPVVTDWDNDGDLDIITQDAEKATVYFIENTGSRSDPVFAKPAQPLMLEGEPWTQMWRTRPAVVDYDGDGKHDLIFVESDRTLKVYARKQSSDTNLEQIGIVKEASGNALKVRYPQNKVGMFPLQAVDLNRDGLFDLIGSNQLGFDGLKYFRNVGTPSSPRFANVEYLKNQDGTKYRHPSVHEAMSCFVDYNRDGILDLIDGRERALFKPNRRIASIMFIDGENLYDYQADTQPGSEDETGE